MMGGEDVSTRECKSNAGAKIKGGGPHSLNACCDMMELFSFVHKILMKTKLNMR
jgi:hypothetical protein